MTLHVILVFLAICAIPWAIGLGMWAVARWLDAPQPATLAITDDAGATHRVEAIS